MKRFMDFFKKRKKLKGWIGDTSYGYSHRSKVTGKHGVYNIVINTSIDDGSTHKINFSVNGSTSAHKAKVHPEDTHIVAKHIGTHLRNYIKIKKPTAVEFWASDGNFNKQNKKVKLYSNMLKSFGAKRIDMKDSSTGVAHFEEYLYEEVLKIL